jgi:hypothetical protein
MKLVQQSIVAQQDELARCQLIRRVLSMPREQVNAVMRFVEDQDQEAKREASAGWIPIGAAAAILGRSVGHVRRVCQDRWQFDGLAQLVKTGDAKPSWLISPSADPRLQDAVRTGALCTRDIPSSAPIARDAQADQSRAAKSARSLDAASTGPQIDVSPASNALAPSDPQRAQI